MTYMIGYDSQGDLVFHFVEQSTCAANWSTVIWTSLPYPGGKRAYHTEQCFLTSTNHFGVQYEGGIAIWDHWARTWSYENIPCKVTYPNNAAMVYQNKDGKLDDILIHWQDSKGGHLTGVQLIGDKVNSCNDLTTPNVPTDMAVAAAPNNGKSFFLFGPKGSGWYDISAATSASTTPVQTTSEFQPLPALTVGSPRATNWGGSIWVFGKNDVGLGVWSVNTTVPAPYTLVPSSQGAPITGDFTVANCGTGIIVYGGCAEAGKCSTNLKPGEPFPPGTITPPTVIYVPPTGGDNGGGGGGGGGGGDGGNGGGGGGGDGGNGGGGGGGDGGNGGGGGGGDGGNGGGGGGDGGNGGGGGGGDGGSGGGGDGGSGGGGDGGNGGGGGGGGGIWIPAPPPDITGPPSGGPTVIPPTGTLPTGTLPTGTLPPGILPPDGSKTSEGGKNTGAIIGGIIGGLALICLIALMFIFARRRKERNSRENTAAGGIGGSGHSEYNGAHGGIPPLAPVGPIGDLDEVVVENKDIPPGGPSGNNNNPGGPSGGGVCPPGGPTGDSSYPGGPPGDSSFPSGPSGSGSGVPPTSGGHSNAGKIAGGLAAIGIIGAGAAAASKKKDDREEVSHGHVAPVPVPVPGGPSDKTEVDTESSTGRGEVCPVPVPGGPSGDNPTNQPSGSGGVPPTGGSSSTSANETTDINGKRILLGAAAAGVAGAAILAKKKSSDSGSSEKKTTTTTRTQVTVTKNGDRIYTTTGTGGRTVVTERSENGACRHVLTGVTAGTTTVRTITQRTETGEEILVPADSPDGEEREIVTERDENGKIRYIIGGVVAGAIGAGIAHHATSSKTTKITSTTRIVTERTTTGEIRYIIVGGFSGNAIRVLTERTSSGEIRLIPTNDETGEIRQVTTERTESGETRYIVGSVITGSTVTRVIMGPRIVTERTTTGQYRYVIVDQYKGNAIRTKFERSEETGEFVHIAVKEPEGELRYVNEEKSETGVIRKVVGEVITGNVTTTTRTVSGGVVTEGSSSSSQVRIISEQNEAGVMTYYHVTNGPDGKEIRTVVERTEDGSFRIPGGAIILGAGAVMAGNSHRSATTTKVVGGGILSQEEQAGGRTQITLKLSIMRYERADAATAVPSAAVGTVLFSKFKLLSAGDVNIEDTAYSHVEETKAPNARRTIKWMKTEAHWKREAGMLQHLKSDRYIADLFTLYSLPTFAEYRYVSVLGPFSRTLESYMQTEQLSALQIRQLSMSLSDALRWCHEHHVVHLNVRPASFYIEGVPGQDAVDGNGQLTWKLWNFGHARFVGETVDTTVTTAAYAAPEILNGRKNGDANVLSAVSMDRWSLGLTLYEMHARKAYFSSSAFAEFQLTNEDGTKFEPALDAVKEEDARRAIRGLLEVDAEERYTYETMREVYFGKV
ncbi:hypothetical protein BG011_003175 [Mortierella polycephala]|uniref:Protein kinase domain-containing protein n=1 Tax=Mortierella polycephala TaxID=41804 RepID=A0A9P6Q1I4_9FUNG|nr:hypothetical protein BG011_003175 [Mortierella polycephala]